MSGAYAEWDPEAHGTPSATLQVRTAEAGDLAALTGVMASRGGSTEDHRPAASRLLSVAPFLLLAEDTRTRPPHPVGWSGATRVSLHPGEPLRWLTAGLTVVPEARRTGAGRRLLSAVVQAVDGLDGGPLHSVVNAQNRASLALHSSLGFEVVETGPRFAGIEFDGGMGVLLARPTLAP